MCFPAVNLAVVSVESPHHLDKGNLYFPPAENFLRRYLLVFLAPKSLRVRVRSKFIFLSIIKVL